MLKKNVKRAKQMRTRLNMEKATQDQIFNDLTNFMINNKNRNSATRSEVKHYFDCSFNKTTRIINSAVLFGKVKRDHEVEDLFWLVLD